MKRHISLVFTRILVILFTIGTIISLFIVYKDINGNIAFRFVMGYLFLALFLLIYIPFITIINSRKLKWIEIRKRLIRFISLFVLFGSLNYGLDFIFRPSKIDLYRELPIALGISFGISFIDIIFLRKKKD